MAKKEVKYTEIEIEGNNLSLSSNGDIVFLSDGTVDTVYATAKEIDAIGAASDFEAKRPKGPKVPDKIKSGYTIGITSNEDGDALSGGDISIGCTQIPRAEVVRIVKASQAARKK